MKLFIAEYRLLQKEKFKLILPTVILSVLGILISSKNGFINADASSEQILLILRIGRLLSDELDLLDYLVLRICGPIANRLEISRPYV
ncbi:exported hypothetical protein [[Clostridium] ultunense Esp]|nr:exported hypothetical protein [[Clostridium] ultunense Esp]